MDIDLKQLVLELLEKTNHPIFDDLLLIKRSFSQKNKCSDLPSNVNILKAYRALLADGIINKNECVENLLRKRAIRSKSGIVAVQVLTKPYACPGQCIFCPNEAEMPKSYIKSEPGAARALLNQFDPYKQVRNRLKSLYLTGHSVDKVEMIVLGGTRDVYPKSYKRWFIAMLYKACNEFDPAFPPEAKTEQEISEGEIQEILKKNESGLQRVIGLTIETRPEYVTDENCKERRMLGVTRMEMGLQSSDDAVLLANKRGHTVEQARQACHKLRQRGLKISLHVMPGLYQSTYAKDLQTFIDLFEDPAFQPDEIKLYPTSVIPNTKLFDLYKEKKYIPITIEQIRQLVEKLFLDIIPPYTRIKRLIRDIPATEIVAGSNITNLSQLMHTELEKKMAVDSELRKRLYSRLRDGAEIHGFTPDVKSIRQFVSLDTRSREVRNKPEKLILPTGLVIRTYPSSAGQEYFLSIEDSYGYIYGFTRLLLPNDKQHVARIRELHVYGQVEKIDVSGSDVQHMGMGKKLLSEAEKISKNHGYKVLSVISGIGVRMYYEKLGFQLHETYMEKEI